MKELLTNTRPEAVATQTEVESVRELHYFVHDSVAQVSRQALPPDFVSREVIDASMDKLAAGELSMAVMSRSALDSMAHVHLRSDFVEYVEDAAIQEQVGFLDEDSFNFVWQMLEHSADIDLAGPSIESAASRLLEQYKHFVSDSSNHARFVADPRLRGISHLNAAVEFMHVRDFEASLTELEKIPEPKIRARMMQLLAEAVEYEVDAVTPEESAANLQACLSSIHAQEVDPKEVGETRIATNRSINTFIALFNPLSDGRIYPAGTYKHLSQSSATNSRPSSGDNQTRRSSEEVLGHERRLFTPRLVYGVVVDAERVATEGQLAWNFGQARFVLKEDSHSAEHATFCVGDSMNGTALNKNRRLVRQDADRASAALHARFNGSAPEVGHGSISHYIEAQFEGLHISDIESVVLRPGTLGPGEADRIVEAGQLAAEQGIDVQYIFNWQAIAAHNEGRPIDGLMKAFFERVAELKKQYPKVKFVLDASDEQLIQAAESHADIISVGLL